MPARALLAAAATLSPNETVTAVTFAALLELFTLLVALCAAGQATNFMRMTPLVGEIFAGAMLGPPLAAFERYPSALMLMGEIGLILGIVEAGLHVQLPALRQVGGRGIAIALLGSLALPLPVAFFMGKVFRLDNTECMALAVCLVPSSTGVALTVLRRAKCFNTITGQLVVASTALCDIIALVCISELRALKHPSAVAFATPICAAIAYVLGVGAAAVYLVPPALQWLLLRVPPRLLEKTALSALAAVTAGLCAGLEHGGSSYLLGAFLAGVCFCTLPSITHAWERQVKRLQTWMLRIFFGCTIGFDVPIRKFREPAVLALAAALLLPLAGKAATGVLAKPRDASHVLTVAFSMTTLGELAFVAAVVGHHELHVMSADTFASVCLVIIVSNMIGPALLRRTLRYYANAARRDISAAVHAATVGAHGHSLSAPTPVLIYFKLDIRCVARWGLMADILRCLGDAGVGVVEFRTDAQGEFSVYEAFLRDERLKDAAPGLLHTPGLPERLAELRSALAALLAHDAEAVSSSCADDAESALQSEDANATVDFRVLRGVLLRRWLPGGTPSEWAAASAEDAEAQATVQRLMKKDAEIRHNTRHLRDIFNSLPAARAALESDAAPSSVSDGASHAPPLSRVASNDPEPLLSAGSSAASASGGGDDASAEALSAADVHAPPQHMHAPPPPHSPVHSGAPPRRGASVFSAAHGGDASELARATSAPPPATNALARAAAVDLAFAAAEAVAELEKAREAEAEDPRGLLGFLRAVRPPELHPSVLTSAISSAEATLVAATAAADAAADDADAAAAEGRAGMGGVVAAFTRRLARVASGSMDEALAAAAEEEAAEAARRRSRDIDRALPGTEEEEEDETAAAEGERPATLQSGGAAE